MIGHRGRLALRLAPVEHLAARASHLGDAIGLDRRALGSDPGKGLRHLDHPHFRGAEHHRGEGVDLGIDPEPPRHRGDRAEPDLVAELGCDGVDRIGKGGAQIGLADVPAVRVARAPPVDGDGGVDHLVLGHVTCLQRGEIDEQLPCRTRLAHRGGGAVVIAGDVIGAPHHREDRPVTVKTDQRALRPLRRIRLDRGGRGALHADVERGPHLDRLVGFGQNDIELRQHPVGEIAHRVLPGILLQLHRADIDLRLIGGDVALLAHQPQHHLGAADRGLDVGGGRIGAGCLDQPGNDRRLADVEFSRGVAEEFAGGRVDPVGAAAEIDLVQVELEDLLLGEFPFERHRQHRLARLAIERAVVVEEQVARQLLGDGRGAAEPLAAAGDPLDQRAGQTHRIDPDVRAESLVLDRDHRVGHVFGDVLVGQPFAEARPDLDQLAPVACAHQNGLARLGRFQGRIIGQRGSGKADREAEEHQRQQGKRGAPDEQPLHPHPPARGRRAGALAGAGAGAWGTGGRRIGALRRRPAFAARTLVLQLLTPSRHHSAHLLLRRLTTARKIGPLHRQVVTGNEPGFTQASPMRGADCRKTPLNPRAG